MAHAVGFDGRPLAGALALATIGTAAITFWLLWVIAVVLPARDPAHIPFWRAVAIALFAFSALTGGYLLVGGRVAWLRLVVLPASLAAVAMGLYGVATMLSRAGDGGHFEGYVLVMGLALCGHGLVAFVSSAIAGRGAGRVRGA